MRRWFTLGALAVCCVVGAGCADGGEPNESPRTDLDAPAEIDPTAVVDPAG